jgi:cytochrome oxidase assembly protein ShyY1
VPVRAPAEVGSGVFVSVPRGWHQFDEGVQRSGRRTPDYLVEVRATINNPTPGRSLLKEARSVVERVRLPDWPELC